MIEIHKQKMINELIQKINSWNEYSETIYGYSKQEAENFLKRLQVGVYNSILKNSYWFSNLPFIDNLIQIENHKRKINSYTNITEENYIVYSTIHNIKEYIQYIYYWYKAYKSDYYTKLNNYHQSPTTDAEYNDFINLYNKVLTTNYTWHQAREIVRNIEKLNVKENKEFPHNINEIKNIFNKQPTLLFKNYSQKVKYSNNILKLNATANNLLNKLNETTLPEFLENKHLNHYEEYIRQMLLKIKVTDIKKVRYLLNSLLTPKKVIDLSNENIPQPYLTTLRKHYNYMFQYTTEIEYIEESTEILTNLFKVYKTSKNKMYDITIIYNMILISYGIIPIPLSEDLFEKEVLPKYIIEKTISLAEHFNKQK